MTIRVLVVDDSAFFRRAISGMLEQDAHIEVVGVATNGRQAVEQSQALKPDLITMDIEMPEMDGISAVRSIMAHNPVPILMFSSLTHEGAQATLEALDAGAADFLPKQFDQVARERDEVARILSQRVRALARRHHPVASPAAPAGDARPAPATPRHGRLDACRLVLIGTSTGGPVALQKVLTELPAGFPRPLVLIQHMPASFTPAFAQRLDNLCAIEVREAGDHDALEPGVALLAPGGMQLAVEATRAGLVARVGESPPEINYRPSVDIAFSSAERAGPGKNLGIVMTGMGADGREGARLMKQHGSVVWSQDQASSTVYGMPAAVAEAGLSDRVLELNAIGPELARSF
ncbi:MAG: chemotaxis response regulator protein-glutamate methylesterase [Gammaproteobacteria bacterium]|jgi:two-component system chemotaxis response regulator CheB